MCGNTCSVVSLIVNGILTPPQRSYRCNDRRWLLRDARGHHGLVGRGQLLLKGSMLLLLLLSLFALLHFATIANQTGRSKHGVEYKEKERQLKSVAGMRRLTERESKGGCKRLTWRQRVEKGVIARKVCGKSGASFSVLIIIKLEEFCDGSAIHLRSGARNCVGFTQPLHTKVHLLLISSRKNRYLFIFNM